MLGIFATWLALQESSWIGWASVISLLVGAFFLNPAIWNERADTGIGAMKKQRAFIAITGGFAGTLMLVSWGFYAALVPTSSYRPHDQLAPPPDPALVEYCEASTTVGTEQRCVTLASTIQKMMTGPALLTAPDKVEVEQPFRLTLQINLNTDSSAEPNLSSEITTTEQVRVSNEMVAEIDPSPPFEVLQAPAEKRRTLLPGTTATWTWSLKATDSDIEKAAIILKLKAVVQDKQFDPQYLEIKVFKKEIAISKPVWKVAQNWIERIDPIYKFLTLLVSGIGGLIVWFRNGRRKRASPESCVESEKVPTAN